MPSPPPTWPHVYTVFAQRALAPFRLRHVPGRRDDPPRCEVTLRVPRGGGRRDSTYANAPSWVTAIADALHATPPPTTPFTVPFADGTRLCVAPLPQAHGASSVYRRARVHVDPATPPTRSWTDFEPSRHATCTAYAQALDDTQQAQYRRRASAAVPPDKASLLTNPRFPRLSMTLRRGTALDRTCFDQLDFTCGDWSDLWYYAVYGSYTRMRAPTSTTPGHAVRPRVKAAMATLRPLYFGAASPYTALSPATTHATLTYVFQHLQKGIYVRIRGGALEAFVPFCRHHYTNTVYDQYYLRGSPEDRAQLQEMQRVEAALRDADATAASDPDRVPPADAATASDPDRVPPADRAAYTRNLARLLELETLCARRYANAHRARGPTDVKANPNRRRWLPNNHFVNQAVYLDNPNIHHFRYLLSTLVAHRALPDAEFVLNPRDHPVLHTAVDPATKTTTLLNPYPDLERDPATAPTALSTVPGGLTPILSHTGKDGYADIPLPTVDDIQHYSQRVFLDKCATNYVDAATAATNGAHAGSTPTATRPDALWVDWSAKTVPKAVFRGSATGRGTTPEVNQRLAVWRLAHTPEGRDVLNVELTSPNRKPKVLAGDDGLDVLRTHEVETACGARFDRKRHFLSLAERSTYKYTLCLDGQTRADRMLNEMRTGSLLILPTPPRPHGGHRLWIEAFLVPLNWERDICNGADAALSVAAVKQRGYTHVTLDDVTAVPALVRWLNAHDAMAAQVVRNARTTLFDPVHGLGARRPPSTCFVYDYMEAIVRLIAERHAHSTRRPFTLCRAPTPSARAGVVGIVVGFRDTVTGGGPRTAQLHAFRHYLRTLFPATWAHDLHVAVQPEVPGDRAAFDAWWDGVWGRTCAQVTVRALLQAVQTDTGAAALPPCLTRNLALVHDRAPLALGVPDHGAKREAYLRRAWTRDEAYRRIGEEKFNLGRCKNQGYLALKAKHGAALSHVIFTDIDMVPDHELAPWYVRRPKPREVVALAHRGTVYDALTVDHLPVRNLDGGDGGHHYRRHTRAHHHYHRHPPRRHHHTTTTKRGRRVGGGRTRSRTPRVATHGRRATRTSRGLAQRAQTLARRWTSNKFKRFLGAALAIRPALFEAANGYPNTFWGWGGEDDALVARLARIDPPPVYTVPTAGRLVDLEMAQPVTVDDKLAQRVKEQQKREKLRDDRRRWRSDGLHDDGRVG